MKLLFVFFILIQYNVSAEGWKEIFDTCANAGKSSKLSDNCENSRHLSSKYRHQEDKLLCKESFKIACMGKIEETLCTSGIDVARTSKDCDESLSDTSKKCCNACKIGWKFMKAKINCDDSVNFFDFVSRSAFSNCCRQYDTEDYTDFYTTEIPNYDSITYGKFPPISLTSEVKTKLNCAYHSPCDDNENCVENYGELSCVCKDGFKMFGSKCHDIDECKLGTDNCNMLGKNCVNTKGSYECLDGDYMYSEIPSSDSTNYGEIPPSSFTLAAKTKLTCAYHSPCDFNENCIENNGKLSCECKDGFELLGSKCRDIDECKLGIDNCKKSNKRCYNTEGSFKCKGCVSGFKESGIFFDYYDEEDIVCQDIDECQEKPCGYDEFCTNIPGEFRCALIKCPEKFVHPKNSTDCILMSCKGKICHQKIKHVFKTVSAEENNSSIYSFTSSRYPKPIFDSKFFKIDETGNDYSIVLVKPLEEDAEINLTVTNGRIRTTIKLFVYVSK